MIVRKMSPPRIRNMQEVVLSAANIELAIETVHPRSDGLSLSWTDGHESFFHAIWLRDCCYCDSCGDTYSSKRFVTPLDMPADAALASARIDARGDLEIVWQADGHRSRYTAAWLRHHCYDDASRRQRFHQPSLWGAEIATDLPTVDFAAASEDERTRFELLRRLRDYGFVLVRGDPVRPAGVEAVANLVGDLGESAYTRIFDLTPSSKTRTMGNTFNAVPPHTDEAFRYSPPGVNVLGCVRPANDGGESILVDGFQAAAQLRDSDPDAFDLLCRHAQDFNRIHPGSLDQRGRQPMIVLDDRGAVVGIRFHTRAAGPLNLPMEVVEPYYAAHRRFCERVFDPANQLRFQLEAGDAVLFDNHRVLHARAAFGDPQRHLQICNVARETFHEQLRLLAARLGHDAEAGQVLAAGVS
jgi:gamma-butyrobetaine dioxygenase